MKNDIEILYISVADAEKRYGIGHTSLYELFKDPCCPSIKKLGGKTLIPLAAFDTFFNSKLETA